MNSHFEMDYRHASDWCYECSAAVSEEKKLELAAEQNKHLERQNELKEIALDLSPKDPIPKMKWSPRPQQDSSIGRPSESKPKQEGPINVKPRNRESEATD
jgi:hypothetical protein